LNQLGASSIITELPRSLNLAEILTSLRRQSIVRILVVEALSGEAKRFIV
jgi:hypothetical protein